MGYLLKEALKTLCGVNKWSYAVFWKIGEQNPKLLIWEECYYERIMYSGLQPISVASNEWETCLLSGEGDKVDLLVNKMMIDNHINIVGEGLVGRAAFTGNHQWILSGNYTRELHPPEVLNEVRQQFVAGMQTVAVVPVLPHGVIQLGSSLAIMENLGFVNDVKSLILQLGRLPGVLLSDSYATREHSPKMVLPSCQGKSFTDNTNQQIKSTQVSGFVGQTSYSMLKQIQNSLQSTNPTAQAPNVAHGLVKPHNSHYEEKVVSGMNMNMNVPSGSQIENGLTKAEVILPLYQQAWLNHQQQRQQHTLSVTGYGHDQQPYTGVRNHIGFMMPQNITNRGINSSSDKNSVTPPFGESSDLCNGLTSHLRSISDPYSMSDENKLAGNGFSVGGVQISDSSKTVTSSSHLADNLRTNHLPSGTSGHRLLPLDGSGAQIDLINGKETSENDLFQALCNGLPQPDEHLRSSEQIPGFIHNKQHEYGMQNSLKNSLYEDVPSSGNDLFDILGVDFKNKLLNDSWNNFVDNGPHQDLDKNNLLIKAASARSDVYSASEGTSDSGIFSVNGSDHLLDAVVSRAHFSAKPSLEDSVSCRTTLTNISSSTSFPSSLPPYKPDVSDQMHGDLYGVPKTLAKAGVVDSCLFRTGPSKEHSGNVSQCSSVYGSQISSRLERSPEIKQSCSVSTAYSKKSEEVGKSGRKRLKPGENPRPRPKDRQMIQDRVKELREIIPNGAKCSIDALLERTVKHMLFLQSVTKHADKLKQTGESKIISKEGGLLLKDNFEGGATWAYEVGSQSMVCPIIVEDLNPPRQLLVEILCEDRGLFLEIADMVRGLGLTILKGAMETQNDKIWARFAVEANRDVTRMEIFISLVRLLDQTVKSSAASSSGMMLHQHCQANVSIPATGGSL